MVVQLILKEEMLPVIMPPGDWAPSGSDLINTAVTLGTMVTDGWGLKYFPFADNASAGN